MMAAVIIDYLYQTDLHDNVGIAYLFCSYRQQADQGATDLFAAVLKQLVQSRPDLIAPVMSMHDHHFKRGSRPSLDELMQALLSICSSYSTVYIVVDALDECSYKTGVRRRLVDMLHSLQANGNVRLLFTSRFIPDVTIDFQSSPWLEIRASEEDVKRYIAGQIPRLSEAIQRDEELKHLVQSKIAEAADGM